MLPDSCQARGNHASQGLCPSLRARPPRRSFLRATARVWFLGSVLVSFGSGDDTQLTHHPELVRLVPVLDFRWANKRMVGRAQRVRQDDVDVVLTEGRSGEEGILRLDSEDGRVELPTAIGADREPDGQLNKLRVYFSTWPLTGGYAIRPPLLQPDPEAREADVVGEYQRALAADESVPYCHLRGRRVRPGARRRALRPPRR